MEDAWRQFAGQIGGEFSQKGWWLWRHPQVIAKVDHWAMTFDTYNVTTGGGTNTTSTTVARVKAHCSSKELFDFKVSREDMFGKLGKAMRIVRDIEVGYPEFDREFIIKGNDESKVRALFANEKIRQLIRAIPHWRFQCEGWELCLEAEYYATDIRWLRACHELFAETLRQLRQIGAIH